MRTSFFLIVILSSILVSFAAEPAWRTSTWGMSNEEIVQAFKGEAQKLPAPEKFKDGLAYVGINEIKIDDTPFQVRFIMSQESRLNRVVLRVADSVRYPGTCFAGLEKLLTLKYGQPAYSNDQIGKDRRLGNVMILGDTIKRRVWRQQGTTIEMAYTSMPELKVSILTICYQPAAETKNL